MSKDEKEAYDKLIVELKNEFPFFKKYRSDFFNNKTNKELLISHKFPTIIKTENIQKEQNEMMNYTSDLIEEMEKMFDVIGDTNTLKNICSFFLNSYKEKTNEYYEYINCQYSNSIDIENLMKEYVSGVKEKRTTVESTKKRIDNEERINRELANRTYKHGDVTRQRERERDRKREREREREKERERERDRKREREREREREKERERERDRKRERERERERQKSREGKKEKKRDIGKEQERRREEEKDMCAVRKTSRGYGLGRGLGRRREDEREDERGLDEEKSKERKRERKTDLQIEENTERSVTEQLNNQKYLKTITPAKSRKRQSCEVVSSYSIYNRDLKTDGIKEDHIKNSFEEETTNNEVGFCAASLFPFVENSFHIKFGCFNGNRYNDDYKTIFIIDNEEEKSDSYINNKRKVVFDEEGRKTFLKNVKRHSVVTGWIFRYDYTYNFFYVKVFAVINKKTNTTVTTNTTNSSIKRYSAKICESKDNNVYACLPIQFIHKFEFVKDLNCKGLPFHNVNYFMDMFIRAEIFDDEQYINTFFKNILEDSKCNFDFFITLDSKTYENNELLGFCSSELHINTPWYNKAWYNKAWYNKDKKKMQEGSHRQQEIDKQKYAKEEKAIQIRTNLENVRKRHQHINKHLGSFLFADNKFTKLDNLAYKKKFFLLNISCIPSLIKYHYRNVHIEMNVGNIIKKKQNLIWSNAKLIEAFEIYKNNSRYYELMNNYFYLDSYATYCEYIYTHEENKFIQYSSISKRHENYKKDKKTAEKENSRSCSEETAIQKKIENTKYKNKYKKKDAISQKTQKSLLKTYVGFISALGDKEKCIIKKIIFLNATIYKQQWIYEFLNCIKFIINLNDQNVIANFLLSLVLLELSCYTESFLVLFRIFKIQKLFIESYKLKNVICCFFIRQIKKYINKETIWNAVLNFPNFDIFSMHQQNCDEYRKKIFRRNVNIISALRNM